MRSKIIHQNWVKSVSIFFTFFMCMFSFSGVRCNAAVVPQEYFVSSTSTLSSGTEFTVSVFVNSPVPINALDLSLAYPADKIQFLNADPAHSIVGFWQGATVLTSEGHIDLAGGILPAFIGTGGLVSALHFKAQSAGNVTISFGPSSLFDADGKGTQASVDGPPIELSIHANTPTIVIPPALPSKPDPLDTTPPILVVRLIKDSVSGSALVVYHASDPESGVHSVEMRTMAWWKWSAWQEISNPSPYSPSVWSVEVRATNNVGEETVQTFTTAHRNLLECCVILFVFGVVIVFAMRYNKGWHSPKV